jgi:hypothetical protein
MKKLALFLLSLSMVSGSVFANADAENAPAEAQEASCAYTQFFNKTWEGTKKNKYELAATAFVLGAVAATYKHVKSCKCSAGTNCAKQCAQGCGCSEQQARA